MYVYKAQLLNIVITNFTTNFYIFLSFLKYIIFLTIKRKKE